MILGAYCEYCLALLCLNVVNIPLASRVCLGKVLGRKKENKIYHFTQWPQEGDREAEVAAGSGSKGVNHGLCSICVRSTFISGVYHLYRHSGAFLSRCRTVGFTAHVAE